MYDWILSIDREVAYVWAVVGRVQEQYTIRSASRRSRRSSSPCSISFHIMGSHPQ